MAKKSMGRTMQDMVEGPARAVVNAGTAAGNAIADAADAMMGRKRKKRKTARTSAAKKTRPKKPVRKAAKKRR